MNALSSYNPHNRYRNRFWKRLLNALFLIGLMVVGGSFGYWLGMQNNAQDSLVYKSEIQSLKEERKSLQDALTTLRAEAQTANMRYKQLQQSYDEAVPEGPVENIISLVRKQIAEGMDPDRIAFLLRSARPPRNCTDPETQRFVLSSPAYDGPEGQISIAENAIIVKGSGVSVRNEKGEPEAWYDPAKPVSFTFEYEDGLSETKKGVMPLYHAVVVSGREYRFTLEQGARSFAKVTYDSCDYP